MPRKSKSTITRLAPDARAYIEQLLREDRLTLDQMVASIQDKFPSEAPSRSSLHRYKSNFDEMTARMREIDAASRTICGELGEGIGERAGTLLAHAVTTLATDAALRAQNSDEPVSIDEIRKLTIAARNALDTKRMDFAQRKALRAEAREELLREQKERLATVERKRGMSAEVAEQIRRDILGIG